MVEEDMEEKPLPSLPNEDILLAEVLNSCAEASVLHSNKHTEINIM